MYTKPTPRTDQQSLFFDLESQLNQKHPLYLLANKIVRKNNIFRSIK